LKQINLEDREFTQFQSWLYGAAGIHLSPMKKALVAGRLFKRLQFHELESYGAYFKMIMGKENPDELQFALDLLTTNETYFFREPKHFEFLRERVLPFASPGKTFRVWSAASSSGEEPYSLAMTLAETLRSTPWEVIGSDISTQVLAKARNGHYPMERANRLPQSLLSRYCLKGIGQQEGTFLIDKSLRQRVSFVQVNLIETLPQLGEFDVIFLRNVMIYFDAPTQRRVLERIHRVLKPGGMLFVGHAENFSESRDLFTLRGKTVYERR